MPDLGPSPAPQVLDAAQTEALRLAEQDRLWAGVTGQYTDATRPADTFAGYLDDSQRLASMKKCITDAGLKLDTGTDASGTVVDYGASTTTREESIASFSCQTAFRSAPSTPPSSDQLGYMYDYLTEFLVPCYAANGIANQPAPSRTQFVALWPNQGWFPTSGSALMGTELDTQLNAACPPAR